jgi:hypothetical protein
MKTLLVTVLALVVVFNAYAQKALQEFQYKADSIGRMVNARQQAKADSLYNAKYVQALERSNELQNGNNTYYSVPIALLTLIVTVFAIVIGFNYYNLTEHHKKALNDQRTEATNALDAQVKLFNETVEKQETKFNSLIERFDDLSEEIKKSNDDWTSEATDKLKNFDERLKGVKDGGETVEKLKQEFEGIKETVVKISRKEHLERANKAISSAYKTIEAVNKAKKTSKLIDAFMKDNELICPHCGHKFSRILATIVKEVPLTYKCPDIFCGKDVKPHPTLFNMDEI